MNATQDSSCHECFCDLDITLILAEFEVSGFCEYVVTLKWQRVIWTSSDQYRPVKDQKEEKALPRGSAYLRQERRRQDSTVGAGLLLEPVLDCRRVTEKCQSLQGYLIFHSFGGGWMAVAALPRKPQHGRKEGHAHMCHSAEELPAVCTLPSSYCGGSIRVLSYKPKITEVCPSKPPPPSLPFSWCQL